MLISVKKLRFFSFQYFRKEAQNIEDKDQATSTTTTTTSSVKKELPTTTYSDSDQVWTSLIKFDRVISGQITP